MLKASIKREKLLAKEAQASLLLAVYLFSTH